VKDNGDNEEVDVNKIAGIMKEGALLVYLKERCLDLVGRRPCKTKFLEQRVFWNRLLMQQWRKVGSWLNDCSGVRKVAGSMIAVA